MILLLLSQLQTRDCRARFSGQECWTHCIQPCRRRYCTLHGGLTINRRFAQDTERLFRQREQWTPAAPRFSSTIDVIDTRGLIVRCGSSRGPMARILYFNLNSENNHLHARANVTMVTFQSFLGANGRV